MVIRSQNMEPSVGIMDSQSVKWGNNVSLNGVNGNKKVKGVDLIKEQINIAAGESLGIKQEDVRIHGAAMEINMQKVIRGKDITADVSVWML